jgi:hypothetical protein
LSSISKTAKWGRLEVHMNYCPCILLFFCIFPHSLTFTFNWFGPDNFLSQLWEPKLL